MFKKPHKPMIGDMNDGSCDGELGKAGWAVIWIIFIGMFLLAKANWDYREQQRVIENKTKVSELGDDK